MNYNKHRFTVEEFLALPVYEEARLAEIGIPFLLQGKMTRQKDYLQFLIKEHTEEGIRKQIEKETQDNPRVDHQIKVNFWRRWKDGNVGQFGGVIYFIPPGTTLQDDKIILNLGDGLTFKYDDGRIIDEDKWRRDQFKEPMGG